jgi:hypothetical protein
MRSVPEQSESSRFLQSQPDNAALEEPRNAKRLKPKETDQGRVTEYWLVHSYTRGQHQHLISDALQVGWQLHGVTMILNVPGHQKHQLTLLQALIR